MELLSEVQHSNRFGCHCSAIDEANCGDYDDYSAEARWTYYGWTAGGCYVHDTTCRAPWWVSVSVAVVGAFVPGYNVIWFELLLNPFLLCEFDFASFLYGGGCANNQPDEWSYETTVYRNIFTHSYFDYEAACAGGGSCGDDICDTQDCLEDETPGDGCEENNENNYCQADCVG